MALIAFCCVATIIGASAVENDDNYKRMTSNYLGFRALSITPEDMSASWVESEDTGIVMAEHLGQLLEGHLFGLYDRASTFPPEVDTAYTPINPEPVPVPYEFDSEQLSLVPLDNNSLPFRYFGVIPNSIEELGTIFTATSNIRGPATMSYNRDIPQEYILSNHDIAFVVIHDWLGSPEETVIADLLAALSGSNSDKRRLVLVLDWRGGSQSNMDDGAWIDLSEDGPREYYAKPAANSVVVGRQLGALLFNLLGAGVIVNDYNVHIIGHGLGAHVGHFAAEWYTRLQRQQTPEVTRKVGRLTGLCPAAYGFETLNLVERQVTTYENLFRDSATFVDVIHTARITVDRLAIVDDLLGGFYGFGLPMATKDFYPNQGLEQPGCFDVEFGAVGIGCSQNRAVEMFNAGFEASNRASLLSFFCKDEGAYESCRDLYIRNDIVHCTSLMGLEAADGPGQRLSGRYFNDYGSGEALTFELGQSGLFPRLRPLDTDESSSGADNPPVLLPVLLPQSNSNYRVVQFRDFKRVIDGKADTLPRPSTGRQSDETFERFPFEASDVSSQQFQAGQSGDPTADHPSCGLFKRFPNSPNSGQGRVYNGLRPYKQQFPWTVCILASRYAYSESSTVTAGRKIWKTIVGTDETFSTADHSRLLLRLDIKAASTCTGVVIDANWIMSAAHCVEHFKNGHVLYLAIGGLSCERPAAVVRFVVEKRPGHPSRTVFVPPRRLVRYASEYANYISVLSSAFTCREFNLPQPLLSGDIALFKVHGGLEGLPAAGELFNPAVHLLNAVCVQQAMSFEYNDEVRLYQAGHGIKTSLAEVLRGNQGSSALTFFRSQISTRESVTPGDQGRLRISPVPRTDDVFGMVNARISAQLSASTSAQRATGLSSQLNLPLSYHFGSAFSSRFSSART